MPFLGNVPSSFNVDTNNINNGAITTEKIADGAVVNADVSASAAIAGTKISPDFGSQNLLTTGTATAASFIPSSSTAPTNGVYLPAANTIGISTGGSGRLFITSAGDVCFGSQVGANNDGSGISIYNTSFPRLSFRNSTTGNALADGSQLYLVDSDLYVTNNENANLILRTNATERLRITSAGLVGIGTSSPNYDLHINNSSIPRIQLTNSTSGSTATDGVLFYLNGSDAFLVNRESASLYLGSANTIALTIDSSQRVGIGTSTFSYLANKLVIDKGSTANDGITIVSSTTSNASIWFADGTTGNEAYRGGIDYQHSTDKLFFYSGGSTNVLIDSSGRLGIGTTSPSSLLHLEGSDGVAQIRLQRAGTNIYGIIRQTSAPYGLTYDAVDVNTGSPVHAFRTSTDGSTFSERARIDSSGRLLVGTSTGSGNNLLHIAKSANGADVGLIVQNSGTSNNTASIYLNKGAGTEADYRIQNDAGGNLTFAYGTNESSFTERMKLDSSGNFRVGQGGDYSSALNLGGGTFPSIWREGADGSGFHFSTNQIIPTSNTGNINDNVVNLGAGAYRFNTLFAGTGSINTSDGSLKQDIENLDQAELNIATAIKGLIKKFRFIDAVASKGDNARIHVGVIAQEVEQAFVDEGLDPRRYGMFCEDTLEDGSKRLGIRYDELLAFVLAAL